MSDKLDKHAISMMAAVIYATRTAQGYAPLDPASDGAQRLRRQCVSEARRILDLASEYAGSVPDAPEGS